MEQLKKPIIRLESEDKLTLARLDSIFSKKNELNALFIESFDLGCGVLSPLISAYREPRPNLENARVASENLRDLTETLKAQPSLLVRGDPPKQIEVEVGQ